MRQFNFTQEMPSWYFFPFLLIVFIFPSLAVTVDSGATMSYWLLVLPALIFAWGGRLDLFKEEKLFLAGLFVFSLAVALSFFNSDDLSESIGSYERYARCLLFIPLYIFVRKHGLKLSPYLSWGLVLGCLVTGLVAIYQYHMLEIIKPMGARNANRFGFAAVLLFLLLAIQIIFNWRYKMFVLPAIVVSIIIIYAIILNKTRGAMLCIFPFILLLVFYFRNDFDKRKKNILIFTIVILLAIFLYPKSPVAQYIYLGLEQLSQFIEDPLNNYKNSWGIRPLLMYHGIVVFMQSPILGTGLGDYHRDLEYLMNTGQLLVNDPMVLMGAHNVFIHLLAETGLIGFISFVLFVFVLPIFIYLKYLLKYRNDSEISLYALSGLTIMILSFYIWHGQYMVNE